MTCCVKGMPGPLQAQSVHTLVVSSLQVEQHKATLLADWYLRGIGDNDNGTKLEERQTADLCEGANVTLHL